MSDDIEESSPQADVEDSAPQESEKVEMPDSVQKRIDTVVGQRNEVQRENEDLKRRLEAASKVEVPVEDKPQPTLEQFDFDDEKYTNALIDHKVNVGIAQGLQSFQQSQQEAILRVQRQELEENYVQQAQKFSSEVPDFVETMSSVQLAPLAEEAVIKSGPEVAYFIGKNGLAAEINSLDPVSAAIRIGEISQSVKTNGVANRISQAPDPITPPAGSGGAIKDSDLGKMSMDEFMSSQGVKRTS